MELQKVGRDWVTEQQQHIYIYIDLSLGLYLLQHSSLVVHNQQSPN